MSAANPAKKSDDTGDAFELSQLLFVVGHVAIKHIVYLELVEREWKRQKQEKELGERVILPLLFFAMSSPGHRNLMTCSYFIYFAAEKLARGAGNDAASKDGEELDQVAGNAEDEIGDRIAAVRESELLYGPDSLLALYGPLLVRICGRPDQFKVRIHSSRFPIPRSYKDFLLFIFFIFKFRVPWFSEHDAARGGDALVQQVPLRELAVLRREPPPALPHPRDVAGREHPEQHRDRAWRRRGLVQHDH
jgi:hypothetical protein